VIDQQRGLGADEHVADASKLGGRRRLRFCVDGVVEGLLEQHEADRDQRWSGSVRGRKVPDARPVQPPPQAGVDGSDADIIGQMLRFLREADVRNLLTMDETIAALEAAFRDWAAGRASNQPRRRVTAGSGAVLAIMSAALSQRGLLGLKAYTSGKHGARFWVALFDAADGRPVAMLEADWLGRMRTGAASGLATKYLANPDAKVLAVIGAGTQALTQVLAIAAVRPLSEVRIFSRDPARRGALAQEVQRAIPGGIHVTQAQSARAAVETAQVITTITSAGRPVLFGSWLTPGQHLNVCGSNMPDRREVDAAAVARADLLVADDVEAARLEAGDLLLAEAEGTLTWPRVHSLREVVAGGPGRQQGSDLTLFKSVGLAVEDIAAAAVVLARAEARGVGQPLPD
jgi:ornithine cyclodeaminase/alanine dehydrogenase-like protein (mu-crystallin family)